MSDLTILLTWFGLGVFGAVIAPRGMNEGSIPLLIVMGPIAPLLALMVRSWMRGSKPDREERRRE